MKRVLLLLVLSLPMMPMKADAQSVNSICGASFGSSYYVVMNALSQVYGKTDDAFYQNERIMYFGKNFEGIMFDSLIFNFVTKGNQKLFNGAKFEVSYTSENEALEARAKLINSIGENFNVKKVTTPEGYVDYHGGSSPLDSSKPGFVIYLEGGEKYTSVVLEFGPYGY